MHSGFAAYFYESVGGIKTSFDKVGYREFIVHPVCSNTITQSSVIVPSPYGNIDSRWQKNENNFSMSLHVPFNTRAKIVLSEEELRTLRINGENWSSFQNKKIVEQADNVVLSVGSGMYKLEYVTSN